MTKYTSDFLLEMLSALVEANVLETPEDVIYALEKPWKYDSDYAALVTCYVCDERYVDDGDGCTHCGAEAYY